MDKIQEGGKNLGSKVPCSMPDKVWVKYVNQNENKIK